MTEPTTPPAEAEAARATVAALWGTAPAANTEAQPPAGYVAREGANPNPARSGDSELRDTARQLFHRD